MDVKSSPGTVVSIFLKTISGVDTQDWDGIMAIYFGDGADNFSQSSDRCPTWIRLTNGSQALYSNFTSRSPSVKLIYATFTSQSVVAVTLRVHKIERKFVYLGTPSS